jgi:NAD(P)-dependent dehydrogenase (short-subunit alcohol dehydrogenase family)
MFDLTQRLLPAVPADGRVLVLGSTVGQLKLLKNPEWLARLPGADLATLGQFLQQYQRSVEQGTCQQQGLYPQPYPVSKLVCNLFAKALAQQLASPRVYAVCPGLVKTALSQFRGKRTPEEGADTPFRLVTEEVPSEFHGQLIKDMQVQKYL